MVPLSSSGRSDTVSSSEKGRAESGMFRLIHGGAPLVISRVIRTLNWVIRILK